MLNLTCREPLMLIAIIMLEKVSRGVGTNGKLLYEKVKKLIALRTIFGICEVFSYLFYFSENLIYFKNPINIALFSLLKHLQPTM